jgi:hypothetical protein
MVSLWKTSRAIRTPQRIVTTGQTFTLWKALSGTNEEVENWWIRQHQQAQFRAGMLTAVRRRV